MASPVLVHVRVHAAGKAFTKFAQTLRALPEYAEQLTPQDIEDEFDRFKIWANNIAAHRIGRTSLEHRLQDASRLKDEINGLLLALEQSLTRAIAILEGEVVPWDALSGSDSDDDASNTSSKADGNTEIHQLVSSVKSIVTCLFRLSMAIRDPASDDRLHGTIAVDESYSEEHDIIHVRAKYPHCPEYLIERLGRAISARRQYFSYRAQHHQTLSKKVELTGFEQPRTENTSNSTEVTPFPSSKGIHPTMSRGKDYRVPQTSYSTTTNATIAVPTLPKEAKQNQHFECPLCYNIVSIHTSAVWKEHVYRDLHPYSCTFEQCPMEDHLFASRHDWYRHELEAHRSTFQCIPECDMLFQDIANYENHVSIAHPELASSTILTALKATARKAVSATAQADCPLCTSKMAVNALQHHVGGHQEELALFALPSNLEEAEETTEDDEEITEDNKETIKRATTVQIYCLDCHHTWYGIRKATCPKCGSTATEIVEEAMLSWSWEDLPSHIADGSSVSKRSRAAREGDVDEPAGHVNKKRIPSPDIYGEAVALFGFRREHENELNLVEGQRIWISYRQERGWLVAQDIKTGESGLVPEEYVRLLRNIEGVRGSAATDMNVRAGMKMASSADSDLLPDASDDDEGFYSPPLSPEQRGTEELMAELYLRDEPLSGGFEPDASNDEDIGSFPYRRDGG